MIPRLTFSPASAISGKPTGQLNRAYVTVHPLSQFFCLQMKKYRKKRLSEQAAAPAVTEDKKVESVEAIEEVAMLIQLI